MTKINNVIYGDVEQYHGHEFYMESDLMDQFNLRYNNVNYGLKGFIVRMVVRKRIILNRVD